jgi:acyl carrier protein
MKGYNMLCDIHETVQEIVAEALKMRGIDAKPAPDTSLIDSGMLDSVSIVAFVGCLEKAFQIEISMSDMTLDNFDNTQVISELVRSKIASRGQDVDNP